MLDHTERAKALALAIHSNAVNFSGDSVPKSVALIEAAFAEVERGALMRAQNAAADASRTMFPKPRSRIGAENACWAAARAIGALLNAIPELRHD